MYIRKRQMISSPNGKREKEGNRKRKGGFREQKEKPAQFLVRKRRKGKRKRRPISNYERKKKKKKGEVTTNRNRNEARYPLKAGQKREKMETNSKGKRAATQLPKRQRSQNKNVHTASPPQKNQTQDSFSIVVLHPKFPLFVFFFFLATFNK
jgi:beta-phosphoglucomutase-like phosphatase (HAD superfamily)